MTVYGIAAGAPFLGANKEQALVRQVHTKLSASSITFLFSIFLYVFGVMYHVLASINQQDIRST